MTDPSLDEIERAGREALRRLPAEVVRLNHGRVVVIDVASGRHFIADDIAAALERARAKAPEGALFIGRVVAPAAKT